MIFTGKNKIIGFKQIVKEKYFGLLDKLLCLIRTCEQNPFKKSLNCYGNVIFWKEN